MSGTGHHVEMDGADDCLESWAKVISLTDSHQRNWKISTNGGRMSAAGGDVMDGLLECGKNDFCHLF